MKRRDACVFAALTLTVLVANGCGGRYSDAERLAAAESIVGGPATAAATSPETGARRTATAPVPVGLPDPEGIPTLPGPNAGSTAAAGPGQNPGVRPGGASPGPGGGSTSTAGSGPTTPNPAGSGAQPAAPVAAGAASGSAGAAPTSGPKAPVKLASIGVRSGVLGGVFTPYHEGAVAWVNDVNRRGGLAGHPVQLISVDDGDDPRKALSAAKRLVEEERVTAFYAAHTVTTFDAIIPYLEGKGIPVVGSSMSNVDHETTPIFFNTAFSARSGLMWNHLLPLFLFHPEIKDIGVLYCGEASVCKVTISELQSTAPQHGYRLRYTAQVSVAQPDYTAEVLAARNAGAQALVLVMDNYSAVRIAASAHRQGYSPVFTIQGSAHAEKFLRDGGKEAEGFLMGGLGLHWTSPLLDDFRGAYQASVPSGAGLSSMAIASWNSGKLLEKVAPTWPAVPGPADVIASLRALRGETLGGLIPPATFRPGAKAGTQCSTVLEIRNGQFMPFQGRNEYHCAPGYQPG